MVYTLRAKTKGKQHFVRGRIKGEKAGAEDRPIGSDAAATRASSAEPPANRPPKKVAHFPRTTIARRDLAPALS